MGQQRERVLETPLDNAWRLAEELSREKATDHRRRLAQFFTPPEVARFLARLASTGRAPKRILDPGAGTGILACALTERLTESAHVDAYEIDRDAADLCEQALSHAAKWLETERGVTLTFEVRRDDFVLQNAEYLNPGLYTADVGSKYDVAILNPPYFKLPKSDPRSMAAQSIVHGQPNIYALFMGCAASLLEPGGVMVSITPRSFAAGDYFRRFRRYLFSMIVPEAIHLFGSRRDAFRGDAVLQENVIIRSRRGVPGGSEVVAVSESEGIADLNASEARLVPLRDVVDLASTDITLRIPANDLDDAVVEFLRGWTSSLNSLGLLVSTGPLVAFRGMQFLRAEPGPSTVPLLWLHNVKPLAVRWPAPANGKMQYVASISESRKLLLPNDRNYVLLRRFTAKEERRRLTAAPLNRGQLPGDLLGFENHLNYIYRPNAGLSKNEALGLAALLNSALLDRFVRISSGHTQVNASELRTLPLPDSPTIARIGKSLRQREVLIEELDAVLADIMGLPSDLAEELHNQPLGLVERGDSFGL